MFIRHVWSFSHVGLTNQARVEKMSDLKNLTSQKTVFFFRFILINKPAKKVWKYTYSNMCEVGHVFSVLLLMNNKAEIKSRWWLCVTNLYNYTSFIECYFSYFLKLSLHCKVRVYWNIDSQAEFQGNLIYKCFRFQSRVKRKLNL